MSDCNGTNAKANTATAIADRTRNLKLFLHRKLDRLYETLTAPGFNGTISIKVSAKDGRPGEPEITVVNYGVSEI